MKSSLQIYYNQIVTRGTVSQPRGMETVGLMDQSFSFYPGEVYIRPRMNMNIGFIELLQFIVGSFDITPFEVVAPNARLDLFSHQSAYGPRVLTQLHRVIDQLNTDQNSRRAIMMIAHPDDTPDTLPCTISMQFQLQREDDIVNRRNLLTIVTMRSSDLIWGLPTDIIQFGGMAQVVARCVGAVPGEVVVNAGNAHVYKDTKLKSNEAYTLGGHFTVPEFYLLDEFRSWANIVLDGICKGIVNPKDAFRFKRVQHDEKVSLTI